MVKQQVIHGDCLQELQKIHLKLGDKFIIVTDPPFNVGYHYNDYTDKRIAKRIAEGKKARLYDWWEINQVKNVSKDKTDHPCQMPLEVMKRIIGILPEDYTIVDPFAGSGTTGLACKELGRDFILIEQDKKYVEIINKRLTK